MLISGTDVGQTAHRVAGHDLNLNAADNSQNSQRGSSETHQNSADLRWVQAMLGHASVESTQIYTQVSVPALQAVHANTHPAEREEQTRDDNQERGPHNDNTNDTT